MADNKNNNQRRNVTGSYPGVTGSYKPTSAYPKSVSTDNVRRRSEAVKDSAPKKNRSKKDGFDFKLWFSSDNVRAFMKQLRFYGLCTLVAVLITIGIVSVANDIFAFIKPDESIIVTIEQGGSAAGVAKVLGDSGVIKHPLIFRLYSKLKKADGKYQYGDYTLNSSLGYDQIISALKKPSVQAESYTVTVEKGWSQDELSEYLTSNKHANATDLEHALNEYDYENFPFVKDIPDRRCRLEGYLPAGEYEFFKGESAVSMISKMLTRFTETVLTEDNKTLIANSGMTLDEVITMASLIQRECGSEDMYKGAAAVLHNRLKSETDNFLELTCSINYVLAKEKAKLTADDKKTDSEYNTYIYSGLTPGPVCSPSLEAIGAVLAPESSAYLYFISDGDKSYFASSLEEHNSNLKKAGDAPKGTDTIR